ncbi:hypothetical protein M3O96_03680 [Aquiflexum sp. TKW24L]|uniref:DUF6134 family protein n=1 Tax=Aquiflexum sp. TKW24L TaxID=2942212 RepID=UPI0020C0FD6B|nr:DUF6134 family protein [Aquiflexum sp. TKW24L]MCL6258171.1 hypothetical protein [Aquiflexum sp. TKW24L]
MKSLYKIALLLFFFPMDLLAQVQEYDISIAGISIGEMTATKKVTGEISQIDVKSNVGFWFFGKIELDLHTISVFNGKHFIKSDLKSKTNKGDFRSLITWENDHYKVNSRNYKYELDTEVQRKVFFSSASFYFEEPINVKEFFAEGYGLVCPVIKRKDHYEVNVNGNKNRFYYVDGKLDKAVMEFPIKNYLVKRKSK